MATRSRVKASGSPFGSLTESRRLDMTASSLAPMSERMPKEVFLKMTMGLSARSAALLVGGTPGTVRKVKSVGSVRSRRLRKVSTWFALASRRSFSDDAAYGFAFA